MDNSVIQLEVLDDVGVSLEGRISIEMKISLKTKEEKIVEERSCSINTLRCSEATLLSERDVIGWFFIPQGRKTIRVIIGADRNFQLWLAIDREAKVEDYDLEIAYNLTGTTLEMNGTLEDATQTRLADEKLYVLFEENSTNSSSISIRVLEDRSNVTANETDCNFLQPDVLALLVAKMDRENNNTWLKVVRPWRYILSIVV